MSQIVGIDEAGRGPLAGPVAVGVVVSRGILDTKGLWRGLRDSKKLSSLERERWFSLIKELKKKGELDFKVSLVSEKIIDKYGISYAIRLGIKRCLNRLEVSLDSRIFLDGSLKAPVEFKKQLTVIKGDEKIAVISLASVCAKVVRDRKMVRLSKKFPKYDFHIHKGYGTKAHITALRKHGPTVLHRRSFIKHLTGVR